MEQNNMAQDKISAASQNEINRRMLLASSQRFETVLPTVQCAYGSTTRIKLQNVGLLTGLILDVTLPYNATVAPTGVSQRGVLASIPRIQLLDFDNTARINCSATMLALVNAGRKREEFQNSSTLLSKNTYVNAALGSTQAQSSPQIDPTLTGAQTSRFSLYVPVAANESIGDLRGMMYLQTQAGEVNLSIDFAALLNGVGDDFVFNGGTMTLPSAPTVQVTQCYYFPQRVGGQVPLPLSDLSTVYEIANNSKVSANIAAATDLFRYMPLSRKVFSVVGAYVSNSVFGGGSVANDLTNYKVVANGATRFIERNAFMLRELTRRNLGNDLPLGTFFLDFGMSPLDTAIIGQLQYVVTPGATVTSPYLETAVEAMYTKGSPVLGGVIQ